MIIDFYWKRSRTKTISATFYFLKLLRFEIFQGEVCLGGEGIPGRPGTGGIGKGVGEVGDGGDGTEPPATAPTAAATGGGGISNGSREGILGKRGGCCSLCGGRTKCGLKCFLCGSRVFPFGAFSTVFLGGKIGKPGSGGRGGRGGS